VFVITSSRPGLLLPTIRSRVLAVRVPALEPEQVARFLESEAGFEAERAAELARRSGGRIGRAIRLSEEGEDRRGAAIRLVGAALSPRRSDRWSAAAALAPSGARGGYAELLDEVESVLRDCITLASGSAPSSTDAGLAGTLSAAAGIRPERWISAVSCVDRARDAALGNGNPQAITAVLLADMARELRPHSPSGRNGSSEGG
jgi:DNA polymerase-3 subunit delta'